MKQHNRIKNAPNRFISVLLGSIGLSTHPITKCLYGANRCQYDGNMVLLPIIGFMQSIKKAVDGHLIVTTIMNNLQKLASIRYIKALSKLVSDTPCRYLLAFFMPEICLASQARQNDSIALTLFTGLNRHIFRLPQLEDIPSYGGVTLQNTKAFWRICEAVSNKTESEPRHPLRTFRSDVVLTQNLLGGYYA